MRGLGRNGFQRLPVLLALVATAFACLATFTALRAWQVAEALDGRPGSADGLPDVLGNRCLNQAPSRL
jgi:hypothetical protein